MYILKKDITTENAASYQKVYCDECGKHADIVVGFEGVDYYDNHLCEFCLRRALLLLEEEK